jgi:hypothetical protein
MSSDPFPTRPSGRRTPAALLELAELAQTKAAERLSRATAKVDKRKAAAATRDRKLDTRKKIIVGALSLEHAEHSDGWKRVLHAVIDQYVFRDEERALFGMSPLPPDIVAARIAEQKERGRKRARKRQQDGAA